MHRLSTQQEIAAIKRRAAPKLVRTRRLANGQIVKSRAGPAVEAKFYEVRESIAESRKARLNGSLNTLPVIPTTPSSTFSPEPLSPDDPEDFQSNSPTYYPQSPSFRLETNRLPDIIEGRVAEDVSPAVYQSFSMDFNNPSICLSPQDLKIKPQLEPLDLRNIQSCPPSIHCSPIQSSVSQWNEHPLSPDSEGPVSASVQRIPLESQMRPALVVYRSPPSDGSYDSSIRIAAPAAPFPFTSRPEPNFLQSQPNLQTYNVENLLSLDYAMSPTGATGVPSVASPWSSQPGSTFPSREGSINPTWDTPMYDPDQLQDMYSTSYQNTSQVLPETIDPRWVSSMWSTPSATPARISSPVMQSHPGQISDHASTSTSVHQTLSNIFYTVSGSKTRPTSMDIDPFPPDGSQSSSAQVNQFPNQTQYRSPTTPPPHQSAFSYTQIPLPLTQYTAIGTQSYPPHDTVPRRPVDKTIPPLPGPHAHTYPNSLEGAQGWVTVSVIDPSQLGAFSMPQLTPLSTDLQMEKALPGLESNS